MLIYVLTFAPVPRHIWHSGRQCVRSSITGNPNNRLVRWWIGRVPIFTGCNGERRDRRRRVRVERLRVLCCRIILRQWHNRPEQGSRNWLVDQQETWERKRKSCRQSAPRQTEERGRDGEGRGNEGKAVNLYLCCYYQVHPPTLQLEVRCHEVLLEGDSVGFS